MERTVDPEAGESSTVLALPELETQDRAEQIAVIGGGQK